MTIPTSGCYSIQGIPIHKDTFVMGGFRSKEIVQSFRRDPLKVTCTICDLYSDKNTNVIYTFSIGEPNIRTQGLYYIISKYSLGVHTCTLIFGHTIRFLDNNITFRTGTSNQCTYLHRSLFCIEITFSLHPHFTLNVVTALGQRRRRWPNAVTTLSQPLGHTRELRVDNGNRCVTVFEGVVLSTK